MLQFDCYHRGEDQGPTFDRLNIDIQNLDLSKSDVFFFNDSQFNWSIFDDLAFRALNQFFKNNKFVTETDRFIK